MAPALEKRERREVHLALTPRRRLEPDRRVSRLARPCRLHELLHTLVAPRTARLADLVEQKTRREPRKLLKTRVHHPIMGIRFVNHRGSQRIPSRPGRQIPVHLTRLDPVTDRARVHPEPPRQFRPLDTPIQIVLQQHPSLPSVQPRTASGHVGCVNRAARRTRSDKPKVRIFGLPEMGDLRSPPTWRKLKFQAHNRQLMCIAVGHRSAEMSVFKCSIGSRLSSRRRNMPAIDLYRHGSNLMTCGAGHMSCYVPERRMLNAWLQRGL